jgi:hypothetical protein
MEPVHLRASCYYTVENLDYCTSNAVGCTIGLPPLFFVFLSRLFYLRHSERVSFYYSYDLPHWFGTATKAASNLHFFLITMYLSTNVPALGASNTTQQNYHFWTRLASTCSYGILTVDLADSISGSASSAPKS